MCIRDRDGELVSEEIPKDILLKLERAGIQEPFLDVYKRQMVEKAVCPKEYVKKQVNIRKQEKRCV